MVRFQGVEQCPPKEVVTAALLVIGGKILSGRDPQQGPNTNVALRARDGQKLAQAKRAVEDMLERVRRAQSSS